MASENSPHSVDLLHEIRDSEPEEGGESPEEAPQEGPEERPSQERPEEGPEAEVMV